MPAPTVSVPVALLMWAIAIAIAATGISVSRAGKTLDERAGAARLHDGVAQRLAPA